MPFPHKRAITTADCAAVSRRCLCHDWSVAATSSEEPAVASMYSVAPSLSRNPLGIVALALVLVYGLAALVTFGSANLEASLKAPLIWFLVLFPLTVLGVFMWLISKHPSRLYSPRDFRGDDAFLEARQGQLRSVAYLSASQARQSGEVSVNTEREVEDVVETVVNSRRADRSFRLLWVDDRPENNVWERKAFIAAGASVSLSLNTSDALEALSVATYAVVISDMGRAEGPREGYVLLDAMRKGGDRTPLVFFASSNDPSHKQETREHGGQGCTNDPRELFEIVMALATKPLA